MSGTLPVPESTAGVTAEAQHLSHSEALERTSFAACVTHRDGKELARPEPLSLVSLGETAVKGEIIDLWPEGVEPEWFCFTD